MYSEKTKSEKGVRVYGWYKIREEKMKAWTKMEH